MYGAQGQGPSPRPLLSLLLLSPTPRPVDAPPSDFINSQTVLIAVLVCMWYITNYYYVVTNTHTDTR